MGVLEGGSNSKSDQQTAEAAAAAPFVAVELQLQPVEQAGVHFDGQGPTELGGGVDLRPQLVVPVGLAGGGVDFGGQGSTTTELGRADLLPPQGRLPPAGGGATEVAFDSSPGLGPVVGSPGRGAGHLRQRASARRIRAGVGHDDHGAGGPGPVVVGEHGSPDDQQPERPLLAMEGADADHQRAPTVHAPAGRHGPEQDPAAAAMRSAALLAMFVAAMALIGEQDTSRPGQFRTLMFWLAGCIALFRWFLSRR
ncbi:unnamed protein product [Urochloa humidicola]